MAGLLKINSIFQFRGHVLNTALTVLLSDKIVNVYINIRMISEPFNGISVVIEAIRVKHRKLLVL